MQCVITPLGVLPVTKTYETTIVLNYYAKGVHETLDTALILNETMDEPIDLDSYGHETATIFETE